MAATVNIEPDPTGEPNPLQTPHTGFANSRRPLAEGDPDYETIGYQEFGPDVATVAEVRRFVRQVLEAHKFNFNEESVTTCELVADELATNAITFAGTFYSVVVELSDMGVRIAVRDDSRVLPVIRESTVDAETGRGLHLVSVTSAHWGSESLGLGKETWADVTTEPGPGHA